MTESVCVQCVDQQRAGIESLIVNNNNIVDSSGQSASDLCKLSLHDERSLPERLTPEGRLLNNGDGVEDSEENGNRRPQRVAVRFADGSAIDEHVNVLAKYFQTVILSGGGKIKSHRLSHDKKILFITYVKAISQGLLETQHKYRQRTLNVTVLEPEIEDDNGGQTRAFGMSLVGKDLDFMKIAMPYLLNYLMQKGIECTTTAYNDNLDCLVFTVKTSSDMKKIFDSSLSETTFSFDGMTLTLFKVTSDAVEPMIDGPEEDDAFLVTLLPSGVKEEDLKLFVEQNSSNTISSMELQTGRAMLTLRKPFDFPGLAQAVHAIPLRGYMLAIQKVPLSLAILVSNNNGEELNEEDLRIMLSYEAQRCTGNIVDRLIQEIAIDKQTKKKAIVKFFDRQVVNEILANCEAVGTLTLYHECMKDEQRSSTRVSEVSNKITIHPGSIV